MQHTRTSWAASRRTMKSSVLSNWPRWQPCTTQGGHHTWTWQFGAHSNLGSRRRSSWREMRFATNGDMIPIELYGPADYTSWRECYAVFRTGSVMLEQITPSRLDGYEKVIRHYHERYGKACWPIIYQADVRARMEQTERIRRRGQEAADRARRLGLTHDYDPAKPWEWVWLELIGDYNFFYREVVEPCLLYLAKMNGMSQYIAGDAPVTTSATEATSTPASSARAPPPPPSADSRPAKRQRGPDVREHKVGPDGLYTHNRRGAELCKLYQSGECKDKDQYGNCARNSARKHQCAKCLSELHGAHQCSQDAPRPPRAAHGKGRSKGKSKKWPSSHSEMHENSVVRMKASINTGLKDTTPSSTGTSVDGDNFAVGGSPKSHNNEGKRILHLFSGPADRSDGFAAAVRENGAQCIEFDVVNGEAQNLANDKLWNDILGDIRSGHYDGMLAGPPCNTFTNARRSDDGGPPPLRGPHGDDRYGLRNLRVQDKEKVRLGTLLATRAAEAATELHSLNKPFIVEQPQWKDDGKSNSMFNLDEYQDLLALEGVTTCDLDQCMFEAKTTKPTTLMVYDVDTNELTKSCTHEKTMWIKPSTGERNWSAHPPLVGKEMYIPWNQWDKSMLMRPWEAAKKYKHEPYLTSAAQAYPGALNAKLAEILLSKRLHTKVEEHEEKVDEHYFVIGRWRNILKRKRDGEPATVRNAVEFTTPLRGKHKHISEREHEESRCWGGMRNPRKISQTLPAYRACGHEIYLCVMNYLKVNEDARNRCLKSVGSSEAEPGPTAEQIAKLRDLLLQKFPCPSEMRGQAQNSLLQAGLLWSLARKLGDPDADTIYDWLANGAPAGISVPILDPGNIFPPDDEEVDFDNFQLPSPDKHVNYATVEDDEASAAEVDRLIQTGFVKEFDSYQAMATWLGKPPHLSKLGMITKEKDGKIKRRLILDCKESNVNKLAKSGGKLLLPRTSDALDDALYLMSQCERGEQVEWFVMDYSDWFYNVPLHPSERCYFTWSYKGRWVAFLTQAQGSKNAPLVCGRVAAMVARITQSMFNDAHLRLQLYVDDPLMSLRGDQHQRDGLLAATTMFWSALGIRLAFRKADRGTSIVWIGAELTAKEQGTNKAHITARAKQEIVDEIKRVTIEHSQSNVTAKKALQSYVGKLNHLAGLVEMVRPFLSDLYGVLHSTEGTNAPKGCLWNKQWSHVTAWLLAFFEKEKASILRTYRVEAYFGKGIQMAIITDASPWGLGGYLTINNTVIAYYADKVTELDEKLLQIKVGESTAQQVLEALAVLVARSWRSYWARPGVALRIRSDNVGILTLLVKLRPKYHSVGLSIIARELALEFGTAAYKPRTFQHIPGLTNDWADILSRLHQPNKMVRVPAELQQARRVQPAHRDQEYYLTLSTASHSRQ